MFGVLLGGCSTVGVYPIGDGAREGIEIAAALWLPVHVSPTSETALTVVMVPGLQIDGMDVEGWAPDRRGCRRVAFVDPDRAEPYAVAHEIAHMLGLGHHADEINLMHTSASGKALTDRQRAKLARVADRLASCP